MVRILPVFFGSRTRRVKWLRGVIVLVCIYRSSVTCMYESSDGEFLFLFVLVYSGGPAESYFYSARYRDVPVIYDTFCSNAWLFSFIAYQTFGVGKRPVPLASKQVPLNTSGDPLPLRLTTHWTVYHIQQRKQSPSSVALVKL